MLDKSIAVAEEKHSKISCDFSSSLSVYENPGHLRIGMGFWIGRNCKTQKRSISEGVIETKINLWWQN